MARATLQIGSRHVLENTELVEEVCGAAGVVVPCETAHRQDEENQKRNKIQLIKRERENERKKAKRANSGRIGRRG